MKEWIREHPYLALTMGYILLFVFGAGVWLALRHDLTTAVINASALTLIYWVIAVFQVRRRKNTQVRLADQGQIIIHLRYPDSRPGSLDSIWNQGIATLSPRSIRFQPAINDTLEPSGQATTIKIQELLPVRRKVTGKDRKYLPTHGLQAITLKTDDGTVEIAAHPESLDKLTKDLGRW